MSSHENRSNEWKNAIHYAVVFQDEDGAIKATGSDSFKDTHSWFTPDLRKRFQKFLCNGSGQPTELHSDRPPKRYRASVDDLDEQKADVEVLPDYSNTQQVTAQYWQAFRRLLQINCRAIGQAWVELVEPDKRRKHPYTKGEAVKPKWWPADVRHKSPHHLGADERITLLISILRMSGKGKITCNRLKEAAEQKAVVYQEREETLSFLEKIIAIRRKEERAKTQCGHTTGPPDEELNHGLIQVSGSASNGGRGRSPAGSPEDQIEEISPTSPSVESSPDFATTSSYPSTSDALTNPMYSRRCQNQTSYPVSQSHYEGSSSGSPPERTATSSGPSLMVRTHNAQPAISATYTISMPPLPLPPLPSYGSA